MSQGYDTGEAMRSVTYCVVPADLADRLHDPLRRHFVRDDAVEVVVEMRSCDRRRGQERRTSQEAPHEERRRIRSATGRRVEDRRRPGMEVAAPIGLPRPARRVADRLVFVEVIQPSRQDVEDHDTARLVTRLQAGDSSAFADLYMRYFGRVYAYARVALKDQHEAEDATQEIFTRVFNALPGYEQTGRPFRAWLFRIVRNFIIDQVRRQRPVELMESPEVDSTRAGSDIDDRLEALDWMTDRELVMFVERLPLAQRQVLLLRYMMDMTSSEIAEVMGRTPEDVRMLHTRALRYLRDRLTALGRGPRGEKPIRASRGPKQYGVLRARRFALARYR